jgi:hypothetical protein
MVEFEIASDPLSPSGTDPRAALTLVPWSSRQLDDMDMLKISFLTYLICANKI